MNFTPIEHRSEAWHKKRLGMPTASQFHRIIQPRRAQMSEQAPLYQAELIAERIFGRPMEKDISHYEAVRWGVEHEAEAAQMLEQRIGPLLPGGFWTDDAERYGCSPDRFLMKGNRREIVEIKCPFEIPRHVASLLFEMDSNHRPQVQGQLMITGADVAHFFSYHPDCPSAYYKIERDEPFIRQLDNILDQFCADLEVNYQRALKMGGWTKP